MILSFKPQFVPLILNGTKIHTLREDPNKRWNEGKHIHMATGVRTKHYHCFLESTCMFKQAVALDPVARTIHIGLNGRMNLLAQCNNSLFAKNDGFASEDDFWEWFNTPWKGFCIHWTNFYYS